MLALRCHVLAGTQPGPPTWTLNTTNTTTTTSTYQSTGGLPPPVTVAERILGPLSSLPPYRPHPGRQYPRLSLPSRKDTRSPGCWAHPTEQPPSPTGAPRLYSLRTLSHPTSTGTHPAVTPRYPVLCKPTRQTGLRPPAISTCLSEAS